MLYGSADIKNIVAKAKELGQPAVAITDYGNLFNAVHFYKACKDDGIKPIIGCDISFCEDAAESRAHKIRQTYHLTLLAESDIGFKNLARIVSEANNSDHFYFRPRVDFALLEKYKEGIICLSGSSLDGAISYFMYDKIDEHGDLRESAALFKANALIRRFLQIFDQQHFCLEVQDTGHSSQPELNIRLRAAARKYGLEVVATNNVHYVNKHDAESHKTLLAMSTSEYNKATASVFSHEEFFMKSRDEILGTDIKVEEVDAALAIANRCNITIDLKKRRLPQYAFIPKGKTAMEHLTELCQAGLATKTRHPLKDGEETYEHRLARELSDISEMGFADYFLIVHDVVSWCLKQGMLLGRGRGSAGGSLVSHVLDITDIDPLQYGLIWERFLNKGRGGLPDIDTDIPRSQRQKTLNYIRKRFGERNVAQIVTLGGLHAKSVLKEVFSVYGMPFDEANKITALVPAKNDEHTQISLEEAIEAVPELKAYSEKYQPWFKIALALEGCYKSIGVHAAAVVISDKPFDESEYPLVRTKNNDLIFGWDMNTVDALSLLKLDILGLATLDDVQMTMELVRKRRGIDISRHTIPLDDPVTYAMLEKGFTIGVFQIEKQLGRTWSKNLAPQSIEELSDLVSLIRPGPMESGMHTQYRSVKMKGEAAQYIHPSLEAILRSTYSGLLYQEQVIEICKQLAGMSLIDADKVRKAMGKKKPEEMRKWKEVFVSGCVKNGIEATTADQVWGYIENFAGYGFNKSHGVGYALLAYETAYLKANYTIEFLCAKLQNSEGDLEKLANLSYDAKLFEIEVVPPRVSKGNREFDVIDDKTIAFGLTALKGVGKMAVDDLIKIAKGNRSFDDIIWALATSKTKVTSAMITALIRGGAFDDWEEHRTRSVSRYRLLAGLTTIELETINVLRKAHPDILDWVRFVRSLSDESKIETIKEKYSVKIPNVRRREAIRELLQEHDGEELFDSKPQRIAWEQQYLGISLSGSEADIYKSQHKCVDLVKHGESEMQFDIAVCIDTTRQITTKTGKEMAFLTVRDNTYQMDNVVVFPNQFAASKALLEAGNVVRIRGKIDERGSLICDRIARLK
jgi:DNA polymerase-3 subunit alpha